MKRFFVIFEFDFYYTRGGWNDFHSAHQTLEEAKTAIAGSTASDWHIVDVKKREIVAKKPQEPAEKKPERHLTLVDSPIFMGAVEAADVFFDPDLGA